MANIEEIDIFQGTKDGISKLEINRVGGVIQHIKATGFLIFPFRSAGLIQTDTVRTRICMYLGGKLSRKHMRRVAASP